MISPELQTLITNRILELPDYTQESLSAVPWVDILGQIAAKYRLNEIQSNAFISESAMVLLDLVNPELYKTNIINHVVVSSEIANQMIAEVIERVITRLQAEQANIIQSIPSLVDQVMSENSGDEVPVKPVPVTIVSTEENINLETLKSQSLSTASIRSNLSADIYREPIE